MTAILSLIVMGVAVAFVFDLGGSVPRWGLGALLALFGGALVAYRRGHAWTRLVVVLGMALGYPLLEGEPYVSHVPNVFLTMPAAVAVGLAPAPWVLFAGLSPWLIVLVRAGGTGIHTKPLIVIAILVSAVTMTLGRHLMDQARATAEAARNLAEGERDRTREALEALRAGREDQARLIEQLGQRQRLESLGLLAGGIAHDFNNLLTGVSATASVLQMRPDTREEAMELLTLSERGARLSRQLIAFAREQPLALEPVDLAELLVGLRGMLDRILGDGVEVSMDQGSERAVVRADRGQLEQLVTNLAVNARDAMENEGALQLALRSAGEGWVELVVSDEGPGIVEDVRGKLFDPFFSTKGSTGLGLATCYGIATKHGGTIEAQNGEDGGATFVVRLPTTHEDPPRPSHAFAFAQPSEERPLRILLVEDDPVVRRASRRLLRREAHHVDVATNGIDALERIDAGLAQPDVMVSDLAMPKMTGAALAREVRKRWPELPVVFVTGHMADGDPRDGIEGAELVLKPFDGPTLFHAIEQARDHFR